MTTGLLVGLLDFVFPRACALCGEGVSGPPHDEALCRACLAALGPAGPILPPPVPLAAAGAAGPFDRSLRTAIHLLKYAGRGDLAGSLGRRLARALPEALPALASETDLVVVPVPLHPARQAGRGFNQAARLALPVARALGAPIAAGALARRRDTPPQTARDAAGRRANVRGAFAVRRPVTGTALLVDDVVTTGATAAACAQALLDAGARRVLLAALARAPPAGSGNAPRAAGPGRSPERRRHLSGNAGRASGPGPQARAPRRRCVGGTRGQERWGTRVERGSGLYAFPACRRGAESLKT